MLDDDHNNNFAAGNATNVVGVWAAREVLKSTLEFIQGTKNNLGLETKLQFLKSYQLSMNLFGSGFKSKYVMYTKRYS